MDSKQSLQEDEYLKPYHWFIQPNTRKGSVYFSYWQMALKSAGDIGGKTILDAGCGDGFFSSMILKKSPAKVIGIDYSSRAIGYAKDRVKEAEFLCESLKKISFPSETFDVIFFIEVLEHLSKEDRMTILSELGRVLKKDSGKLVLSVPSLNNPTIEKHEEHFSKETLEVALSPQFKIISLKGQDRGGLINKIYWDIFRLWKNRYWKIDSLINYWTLNLYPIVIGRCSPRYARRFVAVFSKK